MSGAAEVVDDLLALEVGQRVELEAEQYSWGNPYEVGDVQDAEFVAPSGERWRARRLTLDPEDARASARDVRAVEGRAPPDMGSGYGRLADVELVQEEADEDLVTVQTGRNGLSKYHRDEECQHAQRFDDPRERPLSVLGAAEPCSNCCPEADEEQEASDEVPLIDGDWLARPADEIVETSEIGRDLEEVLRIAERADTWLKIHQRIGATRTTITKNLLWELGLREQSGELVDEDERHHRIERLREVFLDDE